MQGQPSTPVTYRPVQRTDSAEMLLISRVDSQVPLEFDPDFKWNESSVGERRTYFEKMLKPDDFFEAAVVDSRIIGFHAVQKIPYPGHVTAGAILTLWVDPEFRGRGVGSALKKRAEAWARKSGLTCLETAVHATNRIMLALNEKSGFRVVQFAMRKNL